MVDEGAKDRVEDTAAAVLEGALSMVPIFGGPFAVAVNRAYGSTWQRRHAAILQSLAERLDALVEAGKIEDLTMAMSREETVAEVERTLRASMEAASEEKIAILREALVGGIVVGWTDERHSVMTLLERLEPAHINILRFVEDILSSRDPRSQGLLQGEFGVAPKLGEADLEAIRGQFLGAFTAPPSDEAFASTWDFLIREGLVESTTVESSIVGRRKVSAFGLARQGKVLLDLLRSGNPPELSS